MVLPLLALPMLAMGGLLAGREGLNAYKSNRNEELMAEFGFGDDLVAGGDVGDPGMGVVGPPDIGPDGIPNQVQREIGNPLSPEGLYRMANLLNDRRMQDEALGQMTNVQLQGQLFEKMNLDYEQQLGLADVDNRAAMARQRVSSGPAYMNAATNARALDAQLAGVGAPDVEEQMGARRMVQQAQALDDAASYFNEFTSAERAFDSTEAGERGAAWSFYAPKLLQAELDSGAISEGELEFFQSIAGDPEGMRNLTGAQRGRMNFITQLAITRANEAAQMAGVEGYSRTPRNLRPVTIDDARGGNAPDEFLSSVESLLNKASGPGISVGVRGSDQGTF